LEVRLSEGFEGPVESSLVDLSNALLGDNFLIVTTSILQTSPRKNKQVGLSKGKWQLKK